MTKSQLIEELAKRQPQLKMRDLSFAVGTLLEHMHSTLANGGRIEIRGFGSFSRRYRRQRMGRNPKSGAPVPLLAKYVPHFKPGRLLHKRVNRPGRLPQEH